MTTPDDQAAAVPDAAVPDAAGLDDAGAEDSASATPNAAPCQDVQLVIAGLSHDIRNSLNGIGGTAELLLTYENLEPPTRHHVELIHQESQVLRRLLDDLLDFSRIAAGKMSLMAEPFSPHRVVTSVIESWRPKAERKSLTIGIDMGAEVPSVVLGDGHRLQQVLTNLVSNATKYTDRGSIETRVHVIDRSAEGTVLRFEVIDTGRGIPPEKVKSLFEPYSQAHQTDRSHGAGLGLSICRGLVELMGGRLDLTSSELGTTFWFDLMFGHARRAGDREIAKADEPVVSSGRILVVDDSEVNRLVMRGQLKRLGYEFVEASSGADAVLAVKRSRFDTILMDWHMPELDGLDTTRLIRELEAGSGIRTPIIAVTASTLSGDRETCLAAGTDDFIPKPVSLEELAQKLTHWVSDNPDEEHAVSADVDVVESAAATRESVEQALADLRRDLGDPDTVDAIMHTFVGQIPTWRRDIGSDDAEATRIVGHTVKTAARILGLHGLAEAGEEVERADPERLTSGSDLVTRLVQELDMAHSTISALNTGRPPTD